MKRTLTLAALLVALTTALVAAPAAQAANSTCTTHNLDFVSWSVQTDTVNTAWDFKCGGSNNERWKLTLYLQWKDGSGNWHTFDCANGLPCATFRPSATGYYDGGFEHSGTNTWNLAGQLDCATIRFHALVDFAGGSPSITYNSLTVPDIGGC
jgi:opacity protein-like surface antigen